jgi:hypothetical protein
VRAANPRPLRSDRERLAELEGAAGGRDGALTDQDLARSRGLLQARRHHDFASGDQAAEPRVASHDLTRVDPRAHVDTHAPVTIELVVQGRQRSAQVKRELVDRAAVAGHNLGSGVEEAPHHALQPLGVKLGGDDARRHDINEEHRHDLAGRRLGLGRPRLTGTRRQLRRRLLGRRRCRGAGCGHERRGCKRWVLAENGPLELAQRWARLDPELLHQCAAGVLIDGKRLGLPPRAIEREHQLPAQALAQGMRGDQRLELADQLGMAPPGQVGLDALLDRGHAQLLQPSDLALRE